MLCTQYQIIMEYIYIYITLRLPPHELLVWVLIE